MTNRRRALETILLYELMSIEPIMDGVLRMFEKNADFHGSFPGRKPANKDHKISYDLPSQPAGNLATQRLLRSDARESRLRISAPGDSDERQADRIAEQMMDSPATEQPKRQRERLQAKRADSGGFDATDALPAVHGALSGPASRSIETHASFSSRGSGAILNQSASIPVFRPMPPRDRFMPARSLWGRMWFLDKVSISPPVRAAGN